MAVRPARHRVAGRHPEGSRGEGGHRRRRRRADRRRLRHTVRRAVEQHHQGELAGRRSARARGRDDRRLSVRQRPAGQRVDRRAHRGGRHRHRDRVRHRGDEPRRSRRQRRPRSQHPAARVVGHRPARPVHRRRADRQAARHHPRGDRPVRLRLAAQGQAGVGRGPFRPRDQPDRGAGARREQAADVRARTRHSRPGTARHHAGRPGVAQARARGRHPHGGHLVADLRRRRRGAVDGRRQGAGARPAAARPDHQPGAGRVRSRTTTSTARSSPRRRCWRRPG